MYITITIDTYTVPKGIDCNEYRCIIENCWLEKFFELLNYGRTVCILEYEAVIYSPYLQYIFLKSF